MIPFFIITVLTALIIFTIYAKIMKAVNKKKNADFLICHCRWQKLKTEDPSEKSSGFYAYSPVMWIELDGSSHISGQKYGWDNYINQQHRDAFKNKLAQQLAIPLLRYSLPNDTISPEDRKQIEARIASALHIEKTS